jgi:hypothetical protein
MCYEDRWRRGQQVPFDFARGRLSTALGMTMELKIAGGEIAERKGPDRKARGASLPSF